MMTRSIFDKIISLIIIKTKLFFSITNKPIEKSSTVALFAEELTDLTEHQKKQVKSFFYKHFSNNNICLIIQG